MECTVEAEEIIRIYNWMGDSSRERYISQIVLILLQQKNYSLLQELHNNDVKILLGDPVSETILRSIEKIDDDSSFDKRLTYYRCIYGMTFFTKDLSTSNPDLYEWYLNTLNTHEKNDFFEYVIIPNKLYDYISTYNIVPTSSYLMGLTKKIDKTVLAHCIYAGLECIDDKIYNYVNKVEVDR